MINKTYKITRIVLSVLLISSMLGFSMYSCSKPAFASDISRGQFYRTFFNAFGITISQNYDDNELSDVIDDLLNPTTVSSINSIQSPIDWKWLSEQSYYSELTSLVKILYQTERTYENNGLEGMYQYKTNIIGSASQYNYFTFSDSNYSWGERGTDNGTNGEFNSIITYGEKPNAIAELISVSSSNIPWSVVSIFKSYGPTHDQPPVPLVSYGYTSNIFTKNLDNQWTSLSGVLYIDFEGNDLVYLIKNSDVLNKWEHTDLTICSSSSSLFGTSMFRPKSGYTHQDLQNIVKSHLQENPDYPFDATELLHYLLGTYIENIPSNTKDYSNATVRLNLSPSWSWYTQQSNQIMLVDKLKAYTYNSALEVHEIANWNGGEWSLKEYVPPDSSFDWLLSTNYNLDQYFNDLDNGRVVVIAKDLQLGSTVSDALISYGTSPFLDILGGATINYNQVSLALKAGDVLTGGDTIIGGGGDGGTVEDGVNDGTIGDGASVRPEFARHFPLSLPWDLNDIGRMFMAAPQAPVIDFPIKNINGNTEFFHLDFNQMQVLSTLLRTLLTIVFVYSLIRLFMSIVGITKGGE